MDQPRAPTRYSISSSKKNEVSFLYLYLMWWLPHFKELTFYEISTRGNSEDDIKYLLMLFSAFKCLYSQEWCGIRGKQCSWGFFSSLLLMLTGNDSGLSVFTTMKISFPFSYSYSCIYKKTRASFLVLPFLLMGFCQCSQFNLRHKCNGLTLA